MAAIGVMAMPENFKYEGVFRKGKPRHDFYDTFRIRHPKMPSGKRAKIFAPFDALRGFSEAISSKDVVYMDRIEPDQARQAELNRRLTILHELTANGRLARENRVPVEVTFYEPCEDENSEAWGFRGRYRTVSGICRRVNQELCQTICVDETEIEFEDILRIESPGGLFDAECPGRDGQSSETGRKAYVHEILY